MKHPLLVNLDDIRSDREYIKTVYDLDDAAEAYRVGRDPKIATHKVVDYPADLVSSKLKNGKHSPVLDLDVHHVYVGSSTEGHAHLYLDGVELPWWKYRILLRVLAWAGVIEQGYAWYSIKRGFSAARTPGSFKRIKGSYMPTPVEAERIRLISQQSAIAMLKRDEPLF